ncbi:uncharacterized protein [Dermacentor albipictus]|uniref:uncharacterized protein isoform X2 n=1 Tax=Dermacentor albipictus TaxID=60249 RepID=UPI0038FD1981
MSEMSMLSDSTATFGTEQPQDAVVSDSTEDEDDDNLKVSFVICCNLILFIIMIILLMLLLMRYTSTVEASEDETDGATYKKGGGGGGPPPTTTPMNTTVSQPITKPLTPAKTTRKATTRMAPTTTRPTMTPTTAAPPPPPTAAPSTRRSPTTTTKKPTTRPPPSTTTSTPKVPTTKSTVRQPVTKPSTPATTTRKATTRMAPTTTRRPTTTPTTAAPPPPPTTPPSTTPRPTTTTKKPTTRPPPPTTTSAPRVRPYTLICVFEALRVLWNKTYSCTDYVYIRFFTYSKENNPNEPVVFEKKRLRDGLVHMYYDDSPDEWRPFSSYRNLDNKVKIAMSRHPGTRWYLGVWGSAYMRLMSGLFHASVVRRALHDTIRSKFSDKLNMSFFHGFAIINSIIRDTRPLGRSVDFSDIFRGNKHGTPILDPSWSLIHTAAIFPFGPAVIPETMLQNILKEADVVGISTANSTDEPNLLLGRVENTAPFRFASPPNPIMPPGPHTRGMLDILAEFPHWKKVFNKSRLCFSVTTSINYAYTSVDGIDFIYDVRSDEDVQRYSRRRFVAPIGKKLPVEKKLMFYHYDNVTHTHYWRHLSASQKLLSFFAYDMAETLKYKVEQMLKAYPDDRCVVFDDLGEDGLYAKFTVRGETYEWKPYAMFQAVVDVLNSSKI